MRVLLSMQQVLDAVRRGDEATFLRLVQEGKLDVFENPWVVDLQGETLFHEAVASRSVPILDYILARCQQIDVRNRLLQTPLHVAVFQSNLYAVKVLLERGADPNMADDSSHVLLHYAADKPDTHMLLMLLKAGARPNDTFHHVHPPFEYACHKGNLNAAQMILEWSDKDLLIENNPFAMHEAAWEEDEELVEWLFSLGYMPGARDAFRAPAIHICVRFRLINAVKQMLNSLDSLNIKNQHEETLLHMAVVSKSSSMVTLLAEEGVPMDSFDIHGDTPLSAAFWNQQKKITKTLTSLGALTHRIKRAQHSFPDLEAPFGSTLFYVKGANLCRRSFIVSLIR